MKIFLKENVWDAALERIDYVFNEFDEVHREIEFWSMCCDAPPTNYNEVENCRYFTGYCQKCQMGSKFKIKIEGEGHA